MKTFNSFNVFKSIYSKQEMLYCETQDWSLTTQAGNGVKVWDQKSRGYVYPLEKKDFFVKETRKRASYLRKKIFDEFGRRNSEKWAREWYKEELTLDQWCEHRLEAIRLDKMAKQEQARFDAMVKADNKGEKKRHSYTCVSSVYDLLDKAIKIGSNVDFIKACWAKANGVVCSEHTEFKKYTRNTSYPVTTRDFTLNIRRGWHVKIIGGVLTFIRGSKVDRSGMACEWVEQGRAIAHLCTVKGFLVRGEHIVARNLAEAQAINAEHRAKELSILLAARKKDMANRKKESSLLITFEDSLASGNCRPGTASFKAQYEAAIGHEATCITVADLRKYAKRFGVEYYAERVIRYALNH